MVPRARSDDGQRHGPEHELTDSELRYPARSLVVIGGPPGAGKSTLATRVAGATVVDPDVVRAGLGPSAGWPEALAEARAACRTRLAAGEGVVLVATALRHGHRLGMVRDASRAGAAAHIIFVDASEAECRAARAARGVDARIPDGLFEHLLREWAALRRALAAGGGVPEDFASVRVLDRRAAAAIGRIAVGDGGRG